MNQMMLIRKTQPSPTKEIPSVGAIDAALREWRARSESGGESETESRKGGQGEGAFAAVEGVRLSSIAELILQVDARGVPPKTEAGDDDWLAMRGEGRRRLAAGLGCSVEDLQEVVDSYGVEVWEQLVIQARVKLGIRSAYMRETSWDHLEAAVLRKLTLLVDNDKITSVGELIAIARTANQAVRGKQRSGGGQEGGVQMGVDLTFKPGDPENGVLPAGNLGKISLRLSHRVKDQLEGTRDVDGARVIDTVEMLDLNGIQSAVETLPDS